MRQIVEIEKDIDLKDKQISFLYEEKKKLIAELQERKFHEFKESKDERIRKELISFILKEQGRQKDSFNDDKFDSWISWLEKKGEQKPTDKVEPKFKVG